MEVIGTPYIDPSIFYCCVCMVTHDSGPRRTPLPGQTLCSDCIKAYIVPQFEAALKYEHSYPVKFGDTALMVGWYQKWLGARFVKQFVRRMAEYHVPLARRAYCKNKVREDARPPPGLPMHRLTKTALTDDQVRSLTEQGVEIGECGAILNRDLVRRNICHSCKGKVCILPKCGEPIQSMKDHTCAKKENDLKVFEDPAGESSLVRGRDFQLCPSCGMLCELRDGCNYMQCKCSEGFCYVCQEGGLTDHGPHWGPGKCPKWGQPT